MYRQPDSATRIRVNTVPNQRRPNDGGAVSVLRSHSGGNTSASSAWPRGCRLEEMRQLTPSWKRQNAREESNGTRQGNSALHRHRRRRSVDSGQSGHTMRSTCCSPLGLELPTAGKWQPMPIRAAPKRSQIRFHSGLCVKVRHGSFLQRRQCQQEAKSLHQRRAALNKVFSWSAQCTKIRFRPNCSPRGRVPNPNPELNLKSPDESAPWAY